MTAFRTSRATSTMDRVPEEQTAEPITQYLQRTVQRVRAVDRRRPLLWDLHLTAFWTTAALIDLYGGGWTRITRNPDVPEGLVLALSLALTAPLLQRRAHPRTVLLVMTPALLVNAWTGALLQAALLHLLVVFHITVRRPLRSLWWVAMVSTAPVVLTVLRHPRGPADEDLGPHLMSLLVAVAIGVTVRTRRDHTVALEDRARRLEIERDQQARLAAAAERTRIAREMHDIIGHNLSVITGLADGGRYAAAKSPERAAQALDAIAGTSRQALTELRRLLDVLRDDEPAPADLTPQPALADLDRLLDGVRRAGLPVRATVQGDPVISPGRQLTLYRVIQEALTNTLKHAGPDATAGVSLAYASSGAVTLTVTDTGCGGPPTTNSGRGLTGMRERTALYGGTLEAGPRPHPERGWRVRLRLPEEPTP